MVQFQWTNRYIGPIISICYTIRKVKMNADFFSSQQQALHPTLQNKLNKNLQVLPGYIYSIKGVWGFKKKALSVISVHKQRESSLNKFTIYPNVIESWRLLSHVYKKFYKANWYLPSSDGLWSGGVLRNLFWSPFPPDLKLDGRFSCISCHLCLSFRKRDKV